MRWIRVIKRRVRRKPTLKNKVALALHKDKARELVLFRLQYFNKFYNLKIGQVKIKSQTTRWGSCSSKGNLNFNYKVALIPSDLADYLVVHELCHLGEFNHSQKFWNLVGQTIPDYIEKRHKLKNLKIGNSV